MKDRILSLKLPKTFKVLKTVEDVVAQWSSLCEDLEGVGEFATAEDEGMARVLCSLKALMPWVVELWCSMDKQEVGFGGGEKKGVVRRVAVLELDEELKEAMQEGVGWELLLARRLCRDAVAPQGVYFENLIEVLRGVGGFLKREEKDKGRMLLLNKLVVSPLLMGGHVFESWLTFEGEIEVEGIPLEWEAPQEEEGAPLVYWKIAVIEKLAGVSVYWTITAEEGCESRWYWKVGKGGTNRVDWLSGWEMVQQLEREREGVKAYDLMC